MKIEEVITETILAIFQSSDLADCLLLKGGSALRLFDHQASRLSIDADFSIESELDDPESFFALIKSCVERRFERHKFDVIDFKSNKKPKTSPENRPDWWGGWGCEFKLVNQMHRKKTHRTKQRNAFVPDGANSPKITIDISEYEYCGARRTRTVEGIKIMGYSRELLVLEKLRAICQQHPEYEFRLSKNRSRDFYDIFVLTSDMDEAFIKKCTHHLANVFAAKAVPLQILKALWNEEFIDEQGRGFEQVKDTVRGTVYDFDVYVEHIRFLVLDIYPDIEN
jgi:predicted nucleotidyltransferase component of viral defense system